MGFILKSIFFKPTVFVPEEHHVIKTFLKHSYDCDTSYFKCYQCSLTAYGMSFKFPAKHLMVLTIILLPLLIVLYKHHLFTPLKSPELLPYPFFLHSVLKQIPRPWRAGAIPYFPLLLCPFLIEIPRVNSVNTQRAKRRENKNG